MEPRIYFNPYFAIFFTVVFNIAMLSWGYVLDLPIDWSIWHAAAAAVGLAIAFEFFWFRTRVVDFIVRLLLLYSGILMNLIVVLSWLAIRDTERNMLPLVMILQMISAATGISTFWVSPDRRSPLSVAEYRKLKKLSTADHTWRVDRHIDYRGAMGHSYSTLVAGFVVLIVTGVVIWPAGELRSITPVGLSLPIAFLLGFMLASGFHRYRFFKAYEAEVGAPLKFKYDDD